MREALLKAAATRLGITPVELNQVIFEIDGYYKCPFGYWRMDKDYQSSLETAKQELIESHRRRIALVESISYEVWTATTELPLTDWKKAKPPTKTT